MIWSKGVVSRRTVMCAILCVGVVLSLTPAFAQSTGTVSGLVTDQTGAVVPDATVTMVDVSTHDSRTTKSNEAGRYIFVNVAPGIYDLSFDAKGFSKVKLAAQKVEIASVLTGNVSLHVGAANETVEVSASGENLQTMNSTVGTTVSFQSLQELPNLNRDVSSLVALQPATTSNGSVAGAVRDQNTYQLDGGNNSSDMDGTQTTYTVSFAANGTTTGVMPTPVESIEELKVATNNQTADFNGSAGAQVQMVTRRGGQSWHGAAYEHYFGSNFSANTWIGNHTPTRDSKGAIISPNTPLPSNHYNRFGLSAGGPVLPNLGGGKTYLFANYEGRRFPQHAQVEKTVPSALLRLGVVQIQDSKGVYQPYNLNPTPVTYNGVTYQPASCPGSPNGLCDPRALGLNPLVSTIWNKYMPLPNDFTAGDTVNTQGYLTGLTTPQNDNFGVVRLDHDFGANWHLMTSYRYYRLEQLTSNQWDMSGLLGGQQGVPTSYARRPQEPGFFVIGLTTNVTHNLTNDLRYNYTRNYWQWFSQGAPPQLPGLGGALEMGGEVCSNTGSSSSSLIPYCVRNQDARQRYWNGHDNLLKDDLTLIHGNHIFQFGGFYQRNWDAHQRNDNGLGTLAAYVYRMGEGNNPTFSMASGANSSAFVPAAVASGQLETYKNLYAQVLGIVTLPQTLFTYGFQDGKLVQQPFGTPVTAHSITPSYSGYFSDTWHMKPNLTLTYGLGYLLELPPYETNGKQVLLVDSSGTPIRTEDYFANRKTAALSGQVYNPTLGFEAIPLTHRKYPYDVFYGGFSPRISAAWNPHFDNGLLSHLLGNGNTVIRGGYGRQYGRMNGVLNILTPLLSPSLLQAVVCNGAVNSASAVNGSQCLGTSTPVNSFRIGADGLTAPLPAALPQLPQPFMPGVGGLTATGDAIALDPSFRPNSVDSFDLTIQRELTNKISIEVGYIGRLIKHELNDVDLNAVPYMTTLGGQTYADAYGKMYSGICGLGGGACAGAAYTGAAQPFFEAALGGTGSAYCKGFSSCTAAVASKQASQLKLGQVSSLWNALGQSSSWVLPRSMASANPAGGCVVSGSSVCAQINSLQMSLANGYGNYNALFGTVRMRDYHGMVGTANFTWGRALGIGSLTQSSSGATILDPWNLRTNYGPQTFDTKLLFNASMSYHLPFHKSQSGMLGRFLGGWGVAPLFTAQSGLPIEVSLSGNNQAFGESSSSGVTAFENAVLVGKFPGLSSHYNVTASGAAGKSGNAPSGVGLNAFSDPQAVYNSFRRMILGVDTNGGGTGRVFGFARWNLDASLTKETKFTERTGATLYLTMTNVLNHFQPADPTMNYDSPSSWGVVTRAVATSTSSPAYDPRQMEFGIRIHW